MDGAKCNLQGRTRTMDCLKANCNLQGRTRTTGLLTKKKKTRTMDSCCLETRSMSGSTAQELTRSAYLHLIAQFDSGMD